MRQHAVHLYTLAATDSSSGLKGCRSSDYGPLYSSGLRLTWSQWADRLNGPLTTRGWALQELQLSLRVVRYRCEGISWECRSAIVEEEYQ